MLSSAAQDFPEAPLLSYLPVWDATTSYFIKPQSVSWATNTVTIVNRNHGLVNNDVARLTSSTGTGPWHFNGAVTVIDAHTFTIPLVGDPGPWPNGLINGVLPGSGVKEYITIKFQEYSRMMFVPSMLQLSTVPIGTTIQLQAKLHPDAAWVSVGSAWTNTEQGTIQVIANKYNFARLMRTVGTGQPVIYLQKDLK